MKYFRFSSSLHSYKNIGIPTHLLFGLCVAVGATAVSISVLLVIFSLFSEVQRNKNLYILLEKLFFYCFKTKKYYTNNLKFCMNFLFFAMFMSKVELKTGKFAFFVQALQIYTSNFECGA